MSYLHKSPRPIPRLWPSLVFVFLVLFCLCFTHSHQSYIPIACCPLNQFFKSKGCCTEMIACEVILIDMAFLSRTCSHTGHDNIESFLFFTPWLHERKASAWERANVRHCLPIPLPLWISFCHGSLIWSLISRVFIYFCLCLARTQSSVLPVRLFYLFLSPPGGLLVYFSSIQRPRHPFWLADSEVYSRRAPTTHAHTNHLAKCFSTPERANPTCLCVSFTR